MPPRHPDPSLIALGIQQPWAELILRGIKTVEVRSTETRVRGPIYLYASKQPSKLPAALMAIEEHGLDLDDLPRGLLVGTVEIADCRPCRAEDAGASCLPHTLLPHRLAWRLTNPQRLPEPLPVRFLPYGVWFYPFRRKSDRLR